ncbi:MAG: Ig-like domain-containing protein [Bacteroidales bacterium]|nr:Ig-like domain-containing protein [Candidatus Colicola equi]
MKTINFNQSLKNLVNNLKGLFILSLALTTFGVGNVWGAWSGSGQGTNVGGVWYALYSADEANFSTISEKEYTLSAPGANLTYDAKCVPIKVIIEYYGGPLKVAQYTNGSWSGSLFEEQPPKNSYKSYGPISLSSSANKIKLYTETGATGKKYFKNVKVTMAQYIENPSSTAEMVWGAGKVDDANVTKSITIAWCNVKALTYTVTGTGKDQVSVVIENNSEYGKYNTATIKVTYNRNAASTLDATLTIKNDYNSYSKSIKLSGSTTKYDQSLSWVNESSIEPNMMVGATPTIKAISDQGQTVTYTSSNSDVLSVDADGKLTAKSVGEATITASQGGNYKYNAATSISKTFQVKTKDTPIFTPNWSSTNLKVGDKVTLGVQYVSDGLDGSFKAKDYDSNILKVTRESNTITIEALNEGSSNITFAQTETDAIFSASKTYSFNVSKIANTLAADATHSMKVDETWNGVISGKNSDGEITMTTSDATVAYYDVTNNKIVAQNTGSQLFTSKEVTITISQAATYKYTAAEKTIKVTVEKHVPIFTWSNATLYHNQTYNDFFTTNGTNALTVKSSSDDNVAYLVDGSNAQKLNLKTLTKAASTTLTVTQAENYYWAEHTESKTITPSYASDHVPFTLNQDKYNVMLTGDYAKERSWDSGIRLASTDAKYAFDWDDRYAVIKFSGIPDKLSCSYSCSDASSDRDWRVYQSADGSNWGSAIISTNKAGSANNIQLAPTTRYLKFVYSGNFAGYFQNITVTELKTFSTSTNEIDFGNTNKKDMPCDPKTFTFNYANVGHKVTLSTNDNHFSVSPTSITNIGGEKYGSQTITVSYRTDEVHSATNAKLIIKDELGNSKEVTLKGTTTKKAQTLKWEKPYDVTEPAIPIGKTITGAATSSSNLGITYESSDEEIIEIVEDGKAFKAVKEGSATITAKQVGTDDWEEASISKVFKTTNKIIQVISWNQNFTRLLTTSSSQPLTAVVNLEDAQTGVQTYSKERSDLITYTSQNTSVVSVYGSTLHIVGKGETTLTATVPGDDLYESATVTIPVTVREPSAGCEDVLLGNNFGAGEHEFFHYSLTEDMEKVVKIDRSTPAIPGVLSFQHKGKKWGLNYSGEIAIYESTNNGSSWNKLGAITPSEGTYNTQTYNLSRNATHVKFFRGKSATGYHYIKNVDIIPAQFIESNAADNTIDFGNVTVNSVEGRTATISYANVKDMLTITKSSNDLSLSCGDIIDLDCGATGTNTITITFTPTAVGDFNDAIQFNDKNSKKNYTLNVKAKVVRSTQHITWEPTQTEYRTIDKIVLNATASSNNPVKYYVKEGTDVADFVNDVLTIKKDGQITIRAYEPGDAIYEAAVDVDKTFTIRKTNLHFDPLPTATAITYPQTLSESTLTDGIVKDEDGNIVAGTIAWTNPTAQLNAGENQTQGITFTPTNNPAWYNALSSTTTVSVLKATSTATPSATDITYGQKVNESELTNEGTSGTWTWTDTRKNEVLPVGTHEGLQVHFTPSNNNYNELNATVSLTVTKADAQLTWTTAPANVEISEAVTYLATSNHSESAITYSIIAGSEYATIDATTGVLTMLKAGTITVQATQETTTNYNAATISTSTTINGQFENIFTNAAGDNNWNNAANWASGAVPDKLSDVDVIINGEITINETIIVNSLTIESGASVKVVVDGNLSVNGESKDRLTYGNLLIKNGGDVTIAATGDVRVNDFVIESSIGTQGVSESGQITNANKVLYVNGAYIDINLDPTGKANDTQWYGFTVPFPVDIYDGVARKEGDTFRKLTYGTDYMFAEYDMNQRLNSGKGWKYITTLQLQPGRFYYITFNGDYNTYSFKAATNTITTSYTTDLTTNGTGANANWNAVGNSALRHVTASYGTTDDEKFVQVYQNGLSQYMTVRTNDATFVVGCPFFVQAKTSTILQLTDATADHANSTYAPLRKASPANRSIKMVIAPENGGYSDQVYMRTTTDIKSEYIIGRDLAKAGVGTATVQMWINAYGQKLSVNETSIKGEEAIFPLGIYAPKAGGYRLTIDETTTPTYLMENGIVIWDFANGSYVVDLSKGTNNDYSIVRTAPNTPGEATNIYSSEQNNQSINKVIFRNKMYIINNAHTYDAQGQTIR